MTRATSDFRPIRRQRAIRRPIRRQRRSSFRLIPQQLTSQGPELVARLGFRIVRTVEPLLEVRFASRRTVQPLSRGRERCSATAPPLPRTESGQGNDYRARALVCLAVAFGNLTGGTVCQHLVRRSFHLRGSDPRQRHRQKQRHRQQCKHADARANQHRCGFLLSRRVRPTPLSSWPRRGAFAQSTGEFGRWDVVCPNSR